MAARAGDLQGSTSLLDFKEEGLNRNIYHHVFATRGPPPFARNKFLGVRSSGWRLKRESPTRKEVSRENSMNQWGCD